MSNLVKGKATICIVNYKTLDFIRMCLRSIRKFTKYPYDVIVVDNSSQDESVDYLRSLKWIRLIERGPEPEGRGGGFAHAAALDVGLENCNTEFFVSMHSDTFVKKENWLADLIAHFDKGGNCESPAETVACVGSGKIEQKPQWRILLKKATDLRTFKRKLLRTPDPLGVHRYYNRTICSLYRTEVLRRENLSFHMDTENGLTAGKKLYFELVDRGYKTVELPMTVIGGYVVHVAHATQVVNPQEFTLRSKTVRKCRRLTDKLLNSNMAKCILEDSSLDN